MNQLPRQQITQYNFTAFEELLGKRVGFEFKNGAHSKLIDRLNVAMQVTGIDTVERYLRQLESTAINQEIWVDLIHRLTVGETYFFRNPAHMSALYEKILPPLIQQRYESGLRVLRIWSAGCSTGEEPYTLAIFLNELLRAYDRQSWSVMILGTDINQESLARAVKGVRKTLFS